MKLTYLLCGLAALGTAFAADSAQPQSPAPKAETSVSAPKPPRPMGRRPSPEILKEFDKDGDGVLSETERAAMMSALKARRQAAMLQKFDKDGDGVFSDEERAAMQKETKERRERMRAQRGEGVGEPRRGFRGPKTERGELHDAPLPPKGAPSEK